MVEQPPATSGNELANWYWRVVRQFVFGTLWRRLEPEQLSDPVSSTG